MNITDCIADELNPTKRILVDKFLPNQQNATKKQFDPKWIIGGRWLKFNDFPDFDIQSSIKTARSGAVLFIIRINRGRSGWYLNRYLHTSMI